MSRRPELDTRQILWAVAQKYLPNPETGLYDVKSFGDEALKQLYDLCVAALPEKKRDSNLDCVYPSHPNCEVHRPPLPHEAANFGDASAYNQAIDQSIEALRLVFGQEES